MARKPPIPTKEVPDYDYDTEIHRAMDGFERLVEQIRKEAVDAHRNLTAGRRARKHLRNLRKLAIPNVMSALFRLRDKMEALRHGVTVEEWTRDRRRRY